MTVGRGKSEEIEMLQGDEGITVVGGDKGTDLVRCSFTLRELARTIKFGKTF